VLDTHSVSSRIRIPNEKFSRKRKFLQLFVSFFAKSEKIFSLNFRKNKKTKIFVSTLGYLEPSKPLPEQHHFAGAETMPRCGSGSGSTLM
jgi:hypothetical protein